ncbi:MAG: phenylacetate--CoA ligase family protein [Deltaproteobacteria bacterium]|nr:phenylacetate--CoA ligase family protein [Deltaproteobacteria bacterium]
MISASSPTIIPADRRTRNPLITEAGFRMFDRIRQHPPAPKWNYEVGDRIMAEDLPYVEAMCRTVFEERPSCGPMQGPSIIQWVRERRLKSVLFQELLPEGLDPEKDWFHIPPMSREDIAVHPEHIVPLDLDLTRLIVYDTSGTTGHALVVPYHPRSVAQNHPLMEFVLSRYGIKPEFGPDMVACFNVGARAETVVFPNVFSVWNQAGFAKINLKPKDWVNIEQAREFCRDLRPFFLTGDPVAFSEMWRWEIPVRPAAMISTAVTLNPVLKAKLEAEYHCPVIDWYSTTETGPVAYACPLGNGLHILPPDIFVEAVDEQGAPLSSGMRGELAITGGRNPFLPLLRYRTGDFGRLDFHPCPCGDPAPRIVDFEGRADTYFRAVDGSIVNPVDVSRVFRQFAIVRHQVNQRADMSLEVTIRPAPGCLVDSTLIVKGLQDLFGAGAKIMVRIEEFQWESSGGGKVIPFSSELG